MTSLYYSNMGAQRKKGEEGDQGKPFTSPQNQDEKMAIVGGGGGSLPIYTQKVTAEESGETTLNLKKLKALLLFHNPKGRE